MRQLTGIYEETYSSHGLGVSGLRYKYSMVNLKIKFLDQECQTFPVVQYNNSVALDFFTQIPFYFCFLFYFYFTAWFINLLS